MYYQGENGMMALSYIVGAVLGLCIFVHAGHLGGDGGNKGFFDGLRSRVYQEDRRYNTQVTLILGGYCQFYGDDPTQERTGRSMVPLGPSPEAHCNRGNGPVFNLIFGIMLFHDEYDGYRESNLVMIPPEYVTSTQPATARVYAPATGSWPLTERD